MTGGFHRLPKLIAASSCAMALAIFSVPRQAHSADIPVVPPSDGVTVIHAPEIVDRDINDLGKACSDWFAVTSRIPGTHEGKAPLRELAKPEATICTRIVWPVVEELAYFGLGVMLALVLVLPVAVFAMGLAKDFFGFGSRCCRWLIAKSTRNLSWSRGA